MVGACEFSVIVDGAHIQGLQAVLKLQSVQKRTSQSWGEICNLPQDLNKQGESKVSSSRTCKNWIGSIRKIRLESSKGTMTTRSVKAMLSRTNQIDEALGAIASKNDQGQIKIDDFSQLNEKSVEGHFQVLQRPGGTAGVVSNPGVEVSAMDEANLQRMIYYIKSFNSICRTCTHADFDLTNLSSAWHGGSSQVPSSGIDHWPKGLAQEFGNGGRVLWGYRYPYLTLK